MITAMLFILLTLLLFGALYVTWRIWWSYLRISPQDEEFDSRIAVLNNHQANRISDIQLTQRTSTDDAWRTMLRQGMRWTGPDQSTSASRHRSPRK